MIIKKYDGSIEIKEQIPQKGKRISNQWNKNNKNALKKIWKTFFYCLLECLQSYKYTLIYNIIKRGFFGIKVL